MILRSNQSKGSQIVFSRRTRFARDHHVLESFPFSNFVEKVRWCLDHLGVDYEEEQDVGILGVLLAQRAVKMIDEEG